MSLPIQTPSVNVQVDATRKSKWSAEDDARLVELVRMHGTGEKAWAIIAAALGNRTKDSVRIHWNSKPLAHEPVMARAKSLHDHTRWTRADDAILLAGVAEHGRCWRKIAQKLPDRTESMIRNRFDRLHNPKSTRPQPPRPIHRVASRFAALAIRPPTMELLGGTATPPCSTPSASPPASLPPSAISSPFGSPVAPPSAISSPFGSPVASPGNGDAMMSSLGECSAECALSASVAAAPAVPAAPLAAEADPLMFELSALELYATLFSGEDDAGAAMPSVLPTTHAAQPTVGLPTYRGTVATPTVGRPRANSLPNVALPTVATPTVGRPRANSLYGLEEPVVYRTLRFPDSDSEDDDDGGEDDDGGYRTLRFPAGDSEDDDDGGEDDDGGGDTYTHHRPDLDDSDSEHEAESEAEKEETAVGTAWRRGAPAS